MTNNEPHIDGSEFYTIASLAKKTNDDIIYVARDDQRANAIYIACQAFIPDRQLLYFPGWDSLPYDLTSPSSHILAKRIFALTNIATDRSGQKIIITSANAVTQKLPLPEVILAATLDLVSGAVLKRDDLIDYLVHHNYIRNATANAIGEFAVRGSIIDIVADNSSNGYRIDFFGNNIECIKIFDIETQLSSSKIDKVKILPPSELILSEETIDHFKRKMIAKYGVSAIDSDALQNIERGKWRFLGVEQWLPLFYEELTDFISYCDGDNIVIYDHLAQQAIEDRLKQIQHYYSERQDEVKRDQKLCQDPLAPDELYTSLRGSVADVAIQSKHKDGSPRYACDDGASSLTILAQTIANAPKKNFVIACVSVGSRDRIERILLDHDISATKQDQWNYRNAHSFPSPILVVMPLDRGFVTDEFTLITEAEIFGEKIQNISVKKRKNFHQLLQESNNFSAGEIVVHIDHGIGRFEGLETVVLSTTKHDCLKILYDGGDILYVPVENIEVLSKYGIEGEIRLDKLGHVSWQARKAKMRDRIKLSAHYLLDIAAKRLAKKCQIIAPATGIYDEFCASFPYAETDDQLTAIAAIAEDLSSGRPMDRLICGDVGFGKTEVAIRAAFMAIKADDGIKRQVALICPTTLLCRQHFNVFSERFKNYGIIIKQLSRFISARESSKTIEEINRGEVDIVISTHALLNPKITFANLTLLIIDEEQHFGVIQKEKLKEKRTDVHILSLSATPIPRTLQMSLTGIKELSIIATPPIDRLVTKTSVLAFDSVIIKEAILREFHRGGQSFYVCPRISDIDELVATVTALTPQIKFAVAHGQMTPAKLEQIMHEFYNHKYDLLICTSIIESGIDLANANTIIVHRSDKFGLSQLYQLRGRVGRSKSKAYAYFTIPPHNLSPIVAKRLEILQNIDSLGAGFSVASHDMDIRGFGNLLGDEQSGHIEEVGIELYQDMLQQALSAIKGDDNATTEKFMPQINLGISILIPEDYICDLELRLGLYQRISNLEHENEIEAFAAEMIDRFGPIPPEFDHLISIVKLKRLCITHYIKKIDAGPLAIMLEFCGERFEKTKQVLALVEAQPKNIKLRPDNKLLLNYSIADPDKRIDVIERFLKELS